MNLYGNLDSCVCILVVFYLYLFWQGQKTEIRSSENWCQNVGRNRKMKYYLA